MCYSRHLKAHLLRGTFVLLLPPSNNVSHAGGAGIVVARIVDVLETPTITTPPSVKVNIFKAMTELSATETFLHPKILVEPHLRHLPEIVQTPEIRLIPSDEIVNLAFVTGFEQFILDLPGDGNCIPRPISDFIAGTNDI